MGEKGKLSTQTLKLSNELTGWKTKFRNLEEEYSNNMTDLRNNHEKEMNEQRQEYEDAIALLHKQLEEQKDTIETSRKKNRGLLQPSVRLLQLLKASKRKPSNKKLKGRKKFKTGTTKYRNLRRRTEGLQMNQNNCV